MKKNVELNYAVRCLEIPNAIPEYDENFDPSENLKRADQRVEELIAALKLGSRLEEELETAIGLYGLAHGNASYRDGFVAGARMQLQILTAEQAVI